MRVRQIFSRLHIGATDTLPDLLRLHLRAIHELLVHEDGSPLCLCDLEIPYEVVIDGVHAHVFPFLPEALRGVFAGDFNQGSVDHLSGAGCVALFGPLRVKAAKQDLHPVQVLEPFPK